MTRTPQREGLLFIMVAPAGAGKNTLMNVVKARVENLTQLSTATTRAIRDGEQQGREHLFLNHAEFQQMIDSNALLEWQEVHGQWYGIPRATVENAIAAGRDLIADIEYLGATHIRSVYPDNAILIFIQPPSIASLIERMRARGDTEAEIGKRLLRVPVELEYAPNCDYLILNDNMARASETLQGIVLAERSRQGMRQIRRYGNPASLSLVYAAMAIPVFEDEALCQPQPPRFPTAVIADGEQAHEAALRALREQLGLSPVPENLVWSGTPKGAFLPPVCIGYTRQGAGEQIIMQYIYRLNERSAPPPGWSWTPQAQLALPPQIGDALAMSSHAV